MSVRNNLKSLRRERGLTQLKLAEELNVTRQTLIAIENKKYNPSLELALKITEYFNVPINEIFILEDDYNEEK